MSQPTSRQATAPGALQRPRQFTSDNRSGICPEAFAALQRANADHAPSYGDDAWTARAADLLRETFGTDCDVYFTATGTAANSLALASMCQSYHSVICHEAAHIETDECGAPEFFSNGTKLLTAKGAGAKIAPESLQTLITKRTDVHFPKCKVVSLTQATELGTIYTAAEITVLTDIAHRYGLRVHMDGARFANAVAALGCTPADITWKAGVDVLCFGGTKNGMFCSEAVVFFDRALSKEFEYRCKQAGQLLSKMRLVAAQWVGMLEAPEGFARSPWHRNAAHTNALAQRLAAAVGAIPGVRVLNDVQANALFLDLPLKVQVALRTKGWEFYTFIGETGIRLMCSWDNTEQDVQDFAADLSEAFRQK
ncbi:MAG TPA: low specificity L-threonine aldolase [Phycisphaerae bacterium]|jgi:threonine aldolase|nr:low specificity L-threonine aldolase [Phycisphaerae bacterium]